MASFGVLAVAVLALAACGSGDSAVTAPVSTPVTTTTTTTQTSTPPAGPIPTLPLVSFAYSDASSPLPAWFTGNGPGGSAIAGDNTPATNPTTDAGATLGRVLFYDTRLSSTNTISCGSCHIQSLGFGDTARFSAGVAGVTTRHTMALANARFYSRGKFFWDERAATLEAQVLTPIQNPLEMGETLDGVVTKVSAATFYPALFQAAFGSSTVSSSAISLALAQYVRSMVSSNSKFDKAFVGAGPPNFSGFTSQEQLGQTLFTGAAGCAACHATNAQVLDNIHDTGLDSTITDIGTGNGSFKAPSLRNVGLRASFMHDGRFATLQQVVAFYDSGVQANPNLDRRLQNANGTPRRLGLSQQQRDALVAFLNTLTDSTYISAAKFSNPFPKP
jgi:cytochrome c peroxidase